MGTQREISEQKKKVRSMNVLLKSLLYTVLPNKHIIFESAPVYADNTRAVYDEMVRRGLHKQYKFLWYRTPNVFCPQEIPCSDFISLSEQNIFKRLYSIIMFWTAKAFISCNNVQIYRDNRQYAICLMHGAPLKNVKGHYSIPKELDDIISFSSYLAPIEEKVSGADMSKRRFLGFPRNDVLFHSKIDAHKVFYNRQFDKFIYWMPTYRQNKAGTLSVSSIAMPILYNEEIAQQVNETAKQSNTLVVVKPHFAQDISRIAMLNLSNLVFIGDDFLSDCGVLNYELLSRADALLTDYSSVYYDYLLVDRPIGLCWDDFDEYKEKEGFVVDVETVLSGGEKLYNADDLCAFINRVAKGEDRNKEQRQAVKQMIHDYQDGYATRRVVDLIEQRLSQKKK